MSSTNSTSDQRQSVALSIAGSDSGAGAGIQADLKTFSSLGVYGCTVLTLVTAQSTVAVDAVELLPVSLVRQQLETVFSDFKIAAFKTGALGSAEIIETVAGFVESLESRPAFVLDPVMISKHGFLLLNDEAADSLRRRLIPLATIVTPNLSEAAAICGLASVDTAPAMAEAAKRILELGCQAVLLKGGHSAGNPDDLLVWREDASGTGQVWLPGQRVATEHTHGTGCTLSAAITANLVKGMSIVGAARAAKEYITSALRSQQLFGRGLNPVNHFWSQMPNFGEQE